MNKYLSEHLRDPDDIVGYKDERTAGEISPTMPVQNGVNHEPKPPTSSQASGTGYGDVPLSQEIVYDSEEEDDYEDYEEEEI